MGKDIKIAIVAPVHNRKELTLLCLRSISRLNTDGLDIATVIVDDGSTDGTSDAIALDFPGVKVIKGDGNLWFTEGTNIGVREALKDDPDYVLMINDDQIFDPDSLRYMVQVAEKYPKSVVGPLLLLWDVPHKLFQVAPVWRTKKGGWQHWQQQTVWSVPSKPWKVDLIVGNCVLVPTSAVRECGLMDSGRFPNFGDAEYTPRLKRMGWDLLIEPRARIFCQPNYLPPRIREKGARQLVYDLIVDLKNIHNLRRRFYACTRGGPSVWRGALAFASFLTLAAAGRSSEKQKFAENQSEPPLSQVFADAVVDD